MKIKIAIPSNAKQFIRDYRLPIAATAAFIIVILFLLAGRLHDRAALGQVLAINKSGNGGYASLLSNDAADDFKKRDVSADDTAATNSSGQRTTVASATASSSATTQTPATTPTGTTTAPTNNPPVVLVPFGAAITDFKQDQAPALECPNGLLGSINVSKCSKVYSFAASIQTVSGPGRVDYEWRYNVGGSNNGTFAAPAGTNVTILHNQITLSCKNPVTFTAQFALTAPSATQSGTLQINHSCN